MIEKFQAAMLGFAIGDAVAAPHEDTIRDIHSPPVAGYAKALPSHPLSHLSAGQYSDETQTMLLVAESLIARKSFQVEDLAQRFVDWYHTQKFRSAWRFPGNTLSKACRKLAAGTHWMQSGFPSAGVGAVVRTLPIALMLYRQPAALKNAIDQSCRITHNDQRVFAGSHILATVIRIGLEGSEPAPDPIINAAIERSQLFAPDIPRRLKTVKDTLRIETPAAIEQIGNGGFCLDAVPAALYLFLKHPKSFDELVLTGAQIGGDSDAITAMAGAMYGAFNGLDGIGEKWLSPLENVEKIKQLGCDLYRLGVPQRG